MGKHIHRQNHRSTFFSFTFLCSIALGLSTCNYCYWEIRTKFSSNAPDQLYYYIYIVRTNLATTNDFKISYVILFQNILTVEMYSTTILKSRYKTYILRFTAASSRESIIYYNIIINFKDFKLALT